MFGGPQRRSVSSKFQHRIADAWNVDKHKVRRHHCGEVMRVTARNSIIRVQTSRLRSRGGFVMNSSSYLPPAICYLPFAAIILSCPLFADPEARSAIFIMLRSERWRPEESYRE